MLSSTLAILLFLPSWNGCVPILTPCKQGLCSLFLWLLVGIKGGWMLVMVCRLLCPGTKTWTETMAVCKLEHTSETASGPAGKRVHTYSWSVKNGLGRVVTFKFYIFILFTTKAPPYTVQIFWTKQVSCEYGHKTTVTAYTSLCKLKPHKVPAWRWGCGHEVQSTSYSC